MNVQVIAFRILCEGCMPRLNPLSLPQSHHTAKMTFWQGSRRMDVPEKAPGTTEQPSSPFALIRFSGFSQLSFGASMYPCLPRHAFVVLALKLIESVWEARRV